MRTVQLGELADVLYGFAFESERFGDDGDLPLVRIRDVVRGTSNTYYSGEYDSKYVVDNGDLLIGMDGEFNRERWGGGKALLNQRVCKVSSSDPRLDEGYLYRFLPAALKEIERQTPFVTVKHLSATQIKAVPVPLPPIEEQRRIAAVLDAADALRAKRRQALTKLDTLNQALFIDMFGHASSGLWQWPALPLAEVVSRPLRNGAYFERSLYRSDGGGVEMVHMSDAFYGVVPRGKLKRVSASPNDLDRFGISSSDLLVARRSLNLEGSVKPCLVPDGGDSLIYESSLIRISPEPAALDVRYLFALLSNPAFRAHRVFPLVTGATISGINQSNLAKVSIPVPPITLQRSYTERVTAIERCRDAAMNQALRIEQLFSSLQHRAFRGEL